MPADVSCGYALSMDGSTINGLLGRTQHIAASFFNSGNGQVSGGDPAVRRPAGRHARSRHGLNVATGSCPRPVLGRLDERRLPVSA